MSLLLCEVPVGDLWPGFPQDYTSLLHQWYCNLGQCCESGDCRITNNITGDLFVCVSPLLSQSESKQLQHCVSVGRDNPSNHLH